ncbi:hypothetical protein HMSSN139_26670 [Paenibacillus sp. HMSSN-139]|nr:hypothetical protein HMSSN139_26670 [Paenibacillus sp. HMSSN-139]
MKGELTLRELEFRVWHEEEKVMHFISKGSYFGGTGFYDQYVGCENGVWMQCSGIKDSGGKMAYEKDIWEFHGVYYTVEWDDEEGMFYLKHPDAGASEDDHMSLFYLNHGKIIGNVYENPELVKGE